MLYKIVALEDFFQLGRGEGKNKGGGSSPGKPPPHSYVTAKPQLLCSKCDTHLTSLIVLFFQSFYEIV